MTTPGTDAISKDKSESELLCIDMINLEKTGIRKYNESEVEQGNVRCLVQTWAGIPGNDRKNDIIGHKKQIPIVNLSRIYEFRYSRVLPLPELTP